MKQNRIAALLTCTGLGLSAFSTVLAAQEATPVNALSLTTSAATVTSLGTDAYGDPITVILGDGTTSYMTQAPVTTLAPQSYCDLCDADIPEGEGIRTPLGLFICSDCKAAGAGGTTAPFVGGDDVDGSTTTVVTTYNPKQTTAAFTTNMYTDEEGVVNYEYYAYVGETIVMDEAYADLYYIQYGGECCTHEGNLITAVQPGKYCLEVCTTEMFTGMIARINVTVVQLPGVTEPEQTTTLMSCTTSPSATVTTSPYYPEYDPWVTDADGNRYYVGTNAYQETVLKIMEYPQTTFALGEAFNTNGLKVYMIEYRNYNQRDYDVSEVLHIETDYDPNTPGQYTVYVSTDYTCGEAKTDVVLTYHVDVTDELVYTDTNPIMTTTLPTTYTTTTTGTVPSGVPTSYSSTTTSTTTTTTVTTKQETADENGVSIIKGDLTGDFLLKINDVILLNRYIGEDETIDTSALCAHNADYNFDGNVNGDDSTALLRCLAGI